MSSPRSRHGAVGVAAVAIAASLTLACPGRAAAQPDVGRVPLFAAAGADGVELPYQPVRVAGEVRQALVATGRTMLTVEPAHVAHGGRVFIYGSVPDYMMGTAFTAEVLVWEEGGWKRHKLVDKRAGDPGHVTTTLVLDPEVKPGPVPTAVFTRAEVTSRGHTTMTAPVRAPSTGQLRFAYSLDEWDWGGLAPVTVSVSAEIVGSGRELELFKKRIVAGEETPRWIEESLDLSPLGGKTVRFAFRAVPEASRKLLSPHVVWAAPTIVHKTGGKRPPSIVLVSLDGVRARSLGCCGGSAAVTPFMDQLFGQQGVIFERALSQAVQTIPAHMSLFTGLYPSVHGVLSTKRALGPHVPTLAYVLAENGYSAAGFTDGAGLAAELGFGRGFHVYRQDPEASLWDVGGRAGSTFDRALDWIERHRDEPFFVMVHTRQARAPHVPPRGYLDLFKETVTEGAVASELVRYEREIRYLDDMLKRFVGRLDGLAHPDRTLLVVTSGHGEEFGEHGALGAGTHLYEESIRVPLLVRGAGVRAGHRYGDVVGLVDLAPTLIELAGFEPAAGMQGRSIARSLGSGLPYSLPPRFTEAHGRKRMTVDGPASGWTPPAYAISDGGNKLVMQVGEDGQPRLEAYDTIADPEEANDLLGAGQSPAWQGKLDEVLRGYPTACKQVAKPTEAATGLPVAARIRLKSFGYLD